MNILENLNENQRAAVEYCDGPQLVIAGAGSGKTRVLTFKIAYLLDYHKMKPWNILALTFTNKAAAEMKERVSRIGGLTDVRYLNMGTFHSVFSRILRAEAEKLGYNSNFTIYDQSDSRSLIKSIVKEMGLDGIESLYQANTVEENIAFTRLADKLKLMKTAGSDFHGSNKANITLGMEVQESFIAPFLEAVNLVK